MCVEFFFEFTPEETAAKCNKVGIRLGECGEKKDGGGERKFRVYSPELAVDYGCYGSLRDKIFLGKPRDCIVGAT